MRVFIFYEYQYVICEHLSVKKALFYAVFKAQNQRGSIISLLHSKMGFYLLHTHKFTLDVLCQTRFGTKHQVRKRGMGKMPFPHNDKSNRFYAVTLMCLSVHIKF